MRISQIAKCYVKMEFDETYNLFIMHGSKAGVLGASLATLAGDILDLLHGAVGKLTRVLVVGHCGILFGGLV